jgi:hypothetical protein
MNDNKNFRNSKISPKSKFPFLKKWLIFFPKIVKKLEPLNRFA